MVLAFVAAPKCVHPRLHSSLRHDIHQECVASVQRVLRKEKADFALVGREELDRQHIAQVGTAS